MHRFQDSGETLYQFSNEFLVRCPRCQRSARVFSSGKAQPALFSARRLVCANCGYSKDWKKSVITFGGPVDAYFQQPLWLQTPCCGQILWAYNERHLAFLEAYVSADLRQRMPNRTRSAASRLPTWMKTAKHRDEVLRGIERLKRRLP